jgi:hypothetical protein
LVSSPIDMNFYIFFYHYYSPPQVKIDIQILICLAWIGRLILTPSTFAENEVKPPTPHYYIIKALNFNETYFPT